MISSGSNLSSEMSISEDLLLSLIIKKNNILSILFFPFLITNKKGYYPISKPIIQRTSEYEKNGLFI